MSVILNEGALRVLLDTQEGPVGRYVGRIAEAVVVQAQAQFDRYYHQVIPAQQDIDFSMDGSTATIGYIDDGGKRKARRLARAEAEGRLDEPPIQSALERIRGG